MEQQPRTFYLMVNDWTWWVWAITAALLWVGLFAWPEAFYAVIGLTVAQTLVVMVRKQSGVGFAVQLRIAFLALLLVCLIPQIRWLYWLPAVGLVALVVFGYCLLALMLSLLPWNRSEPITLGLLGRTFFSRPDLGRVPEAQAGASCPGGLCTIDAQVSRGS